jgi:hypothetical protein
MISGRAHLRSPDLSKHPWPLDTNQPRLVAQQWATPTAFGFWTQSPDLLRHPPALDTNQGVDYFFDVWSRAPAITPPIFWWTQPPDLLRHPAHLDTNQPQRVAQQWATPQVWWWTQPPPFGLLPPNLLSIQPFNVQWQLSSIGELAMAPQPIPPRAPSLLPIEPYVGPSLVITPKSWWWTQPPDLLRHPPHLDTNFDLMIWKAALPVTPNIWWWSQPPNLLRHPPELRTWQYPVRFVERFYFRESPFVLTRARLSIPASLTRHNMPWRSRVSTPASVPRKTIAPRVVSGLTATNTIMQGYRRMSRAPDLCPAIVAGVEQEYVTFDFGPGVAAGVIIDSVVAVNCYSLDGSDMTPMSRVLGSSTIIASPGTGGASQAVYQLFGNMIAGLYLVQAIVQTSDGQTLSVEARWSCVNATP